MVLAVTVDDAKTNQARRGGATGPTNLVTTLFSSRDIADFPDAHFSQRDPGRKSRPHFHVNDQFQVFVDGKGQLGRHKLKPYSVHFSRAYTPYGPFSSDTFLTYLVMRPHHDPGSQRLPDKLDELKRVPDRQPWQITRSFTFPAFPSDTAAADIMLQAVPDIRDEQGLGAYTLSMKPNARASAPDPTYGSGQFLIVVKGSLFYNNKEYKTYALVFVYPKDGPFQINAGSEGLQALVLNFPRPEKRAIVPTPSAQATTGLRTWQCALCAFVYDEAAGMPEEGVAPGTRWQDIPESWSCPDCGASKADFQMIAL